MSTSISTARFEVWSRHCFLTTFLLLLLFTHSIIADPLSFNLKAFSTDMSDIYYEGDAMPSNGIIELHSLQYMRTGRASYAKPLHLWDSPTGLLTDFSTHFSFTIDRLDGSDGLAFFFAPVDYPIPPNSVAAYLGMFNSTNSVIAKTQVVMVKFDTWQNADMGDPIDLKKHVGINVNSITSVVHAAWNLDITRTTHVWVNYSSASKILAVMWTDKFDDPAFNGAYSSLLFPIDLRKILPEWVRIGFSASTGIQTERHRIHSWELNSTLDISVDQQMQQQKVKKRKSKVLLVSLTAVSSFTLMAVATVIGWLFVKSRTRVSNGSADFNYMEFDTERGALPRRFQYEELVQATNDFANDRRLGHGGSGQVYKGTFSDLGRLVAVKRFFSEPCDHSGEVFINELKVISRLIHKNLVQFIGWCHDKNEFLLVYDYMPNGSLDAHLYGNRKTLPWNLRYKIALGLASAINYLHEDAEQSVIHRDIKSANVLLDTEFKTKLGDFGVAKLVDPRLRSTQKTNLVGTFGYLAPEYIKDGRASKESDIYSFGVVALEIACGRRTYQDGEYHVSLATWVRQIYSSGNILDAVDERLKMDYNANEVTCLLIVGLWCTHPDDKQRPQVGQVIKVLLFEIEMPLISLDLQDSNHNS